MQFKWKKEILLLMGLLWTTPLFASTFDDLPTVEEITNKLVIGTDFVTKLVLTVCFVLGIILVVTALGQLRSHYFSPKMVPLDKPIIYLILGISLFFVPFLGKFFLPTSSTLDIKKKEVVESCPVDIDAPLEFGNEFNH